MTIKTLTATKDPIDNEKLYYHDQQKVEEKSCENQVSSMVSDGTIDQEQDDDFDSSSCDSDEENYGCGYLLDLLNDYINNIPEHLHNKSLREENSIDDSSVGREEIKNNPGKYFFVFFRGAKLDYFINNQARRKYYRSAIMQTIELENKDPLKSTGYNLKLASYEKEHPDTLFGNLFTDQIEENICWEFENKLNLNENISNTSIIKSYKSPRYFQSTVKKIGGSYGNPFVSVSKSPLTALQYADFINESQLKPNYTAVNKKLRAKHRVVGEIKVIVIEANEFYNLPTADVEKLRTEKKIGGKAAVERDNKEIIFHTQIEPKHIAGTILLVYPSYDKDYNQKYQARYGINEDQYKKNISNSTSKFKNPTTDSFLRKNFLPMHFSQMADKLAIRSIMGKSNPDPQPIYLRDNGKTVGVYNFKLKQ